MTSRLNHHINTDFQSTDKSHKISGITPRKCFCRKCKGKRIYNSNPENYIKSKKMNTPKFDQKRLFRDLLDLFDSRDSKIFIKRFMDLDFNFNDWKEFGSYLNNIKIREDSYVSFVKLISTDFGLSVIPTKDQLKVLVPIIKNLLITTKSNYLTSVSSGRALVEYLLSLNKIKIKCNSITLNKEETNDPFMKVENKSILNTEYNKNSKVVYIQWMNKDYEKELLSVFSKKEFLEVLITSSSINGTCYSRSFCEEMRKIGFKNIVLRTKGICIYDHDYVINRSPMSFTTIFYKNNLDKIVNNSVHPKLLFDGIIPDKKYFMKQNLIDLIFIHKLPKFLLELKDKPISHYYTLTPLILGIIKGEITRPPDHFNYDEFYNFILIKDVSKEKNMEGRIEISKKESKYLSKLIKANDQDNLNKFLLSKIG